MLQHHPLPLLASLPSLALLLASAPAAQGDVRYLVPGLGGGIELGHSVDVIDDLDGDGFPDVVASAKYDFDAAAGLFGIGSVRTYSGRDGSQLSKVYPPAGILELGELVRALGDVDGDGVPDYGAGSNKSQTLVVFSGATDAVLHQWTQTLYGRDFDGAGDWDFDGRADVAITTFENITQPGSVEIRSGLDGSVLVSRAGVGNPFAWFGSSIASLGDLDGDGRREIAVGAPNNAGSVYVFSAATLNVLLQLLPPAGVNGFGQSVADAGDFDGDGVSDVVVGAPENDSLGPDVGGAFVYSGATGALLLAGYGGANERVGWDVSPAGDVDGDGVLDFAGAAMNGPIVYLWSGVDGRRLARHESPGFNYATTLAPLGDVNGDGLDEVAAGLSGWGVGTSYGSVAAVSAYAAEPYGPPPAGDNVLSLAWLPGAAGKQTKGSVFVDGATPLSMGIALSASAKGSTPGFLPGIELLVDPDSSLYPPIFYAHDAQGRRLFPIDLSIPGLGGLSVYTQVFELGAPTPSGLRASNGLLTHYAD